MSSSKPDRTSGQTWTSLEPYAQLLRALLPRMSSLTVFNARAELLWSSESVVGPDLTALIPPSLQSASADPTSAGRYVNAGGESVYLFWLRRDDATTPETSVFAVLAIVIRQTEGEKRALSLVHSLVKPALECLRRELLARDEILSLNDSLLQHDSDLDMLLSISGGDGHSDHTGDLKALLVSATEHLRVALAALIVPEKGIALVHTSPDTPMDAALIARAHRHLLSMAQLRRTATIVNRMVLQTGATPVRLLACPVARGEGRCMGVLALMRPESMPEFSPHQARLTELLARRIASIIANTFDALTGLLTRPAFEQRVQGALEDRGNTHARWAALFIDINRMHVINDNYGMHMGDRVIGQLGELIRRRLPPGAFGARISGDRFAMLLPAALNDAATFAESLRAGAEELAAAFGDGKMQVSISVGVATVEPRSKEFAHAFAAAETACNAANDRGRNRVEVYQEADESIVRRFTDINLIGDLRAAIAEERFQLNAQLIVPLDGHGAPHFEILLRMIAENGEIVGPDRFMSAAQRYQLMPTLDRWVISRALCLLKPHAALLKNGRVVFTINFSGQSLQDGDFTEYVARAIEDSGVDPAALCFELTESAAVGNLTRAEQLMRRLRKLGCNIALDDFGTGLSSLAYLRTLPIGMLKIDGSFVRDVLKDPRADSMVQAIAQLARTMQLTTVAEYVETDEIRSRITTLGVHYGQGFAIAQPVPLPEVLSELPLYAATSEPIGEWPPGEDLILASA